MKKYFKKLTVLFLTLCISTTTYADGEGLAGAVLLSFLGGRALTGFQLQNLQQFELSEWSKDAGTSTQLISSCGFVIEARLLAFPSVNVLSLMIRNTSTTTRVLNPFDIEYEFGDGTRRRPDLFTFSPVFFESQRYYQMLLPFPEKVVFKGQQSLQITLPTTSNGEPCTSIIKMNRDPNTPDDYRTWARRRIVDTSVFIGGLAFTGKMNDIADWGNGASGLDLNIWGPFDLSFTMGVITSSRSNLTPTTKSLLNSPSGTTANLLSINLGVARRQIISDRKNWLWSLTLGHTTLGINNNNQGQSFNQTYSGMNFGGALQYQQTFAEVKSGAWYGSYYWGAVADVRLLDKLENSKSDSVKTLVPPGIQTFGGLNIGMGY